MFKKFTKGVVNGLNVWGAITETRGSESHRVEMGVSVPPNVAIDIAESLVKGLTTPKMWKGDWENCNVGSLERIVRDDTGRVLSHTEEIVSRDIID